MPFRRRMAMMHHLLVAAFCTACGTADADSVQGRFDIRFIEIGHGTASVAILDEDGDGSRDVLVSGGGSVTVLRGIGSGELAVHEVVGAGEHPVDFATGDLDGDGSLDLVVANHETEYLTLLFRGSGDFRSGRSERLPVGVSPHPHAVAVADVDEDGHLDIVVDDRDRERLKVFRGRGDGSFTEGEPIAVGGDPYRGMTFADLNADGHLDLITPNPRTVAVQLGAGGGTFSPAPELESASVPPFSTAVGDFDGDGILDVAAGSGEGPGRLLRWFGRGDGTFEPDPGAPYVIGEGPTKLSAGDLDGDGTDDVLVTGYLGNEIAILSGGRRGAHILRIDIPDNPWDIAAGDLNGDGRMDLVTANDGGSRIAVLLQRDEPD